MQHFFSDGKLNLLLGLLPNLESVQIQIYFIIEANVSAA